MIIDISGAQNGGDIRQYSYPNLVDGVFTIYPVMCNRNIDGVRIIGAYDEYQNLIDSFSLKLAQQWKNQSINIILENVGILTTNENGLVDLTNLPFDVDVKIEYIGQNEIVAHDATDTADAQSAIIASNLIIQSSDVESRLIVRGGNGRDGIASGEDGTDGAMAIIVDTLKVNTTGEVIVYGGNGGDGSDGENGKNGADSYNYDNNHYRPQNGANGGNGGNGGNDVVGWDYGLPGWAEDKAWFNGTDGGKGGNGGNGGLSCDLNPMLSSNSYVIFNQSFMGDGGDGGAGGNGGNGHSISAWFWTGNFYGGNGGDGGNSGFGNTSGAPGDGGKIGNASGNSELLGSPPQPGKDGICGTI